MKIIDIKHTSKAETIAQTIKVLQAGGLIIFPTETTYGAGVDATNSQAVRKLLAYKSRREGKPLSIAVANKTMASEYVSINKQANVLIDQFLPGPITVVCKTLINTPKIAHGVSSEFDTLGIRIPDYPLVLDLINEYKKPITATSANASGKKRPYSIDDIFNNLSKKQKGLIDLILDAGELPRNEPSTVIDTTLSTPVILRNNSQNNNLKKLNNSEEIIKLKSSSEQETQEIAGRLLLKNWNKINNLGNGLLVALDGSLGTGKTVFTKGVAKFLNISETIKSPTYSYIEEYDFTRHQTTGKLYHLDMWKVESKEMFNRLEVESLLGKNNVVVIEWFDQIKDFMNPILNNTHLIKIRFTSAPKTKENRKIRNLEITDIDS